MQSVGTVEIMQRLFITLMHADGIPVGYPPSPWICSDTVTDEVIGTMFLEIPQISVFSDSSLGMLFVEVL